jgi:hypothetical protein
MQHKTAWNFARAGNNRLRELLKLYGCDDVVAPVDGDAFGRRASELIRRGISRRWAASLKAVDIASRATTRTPTKLKERKRIELHRGYDAPFP